MSHNITSLHKTVEDRTPTEVAMQLLHPTLPVAPACMSRSPHQPNEDLSSQIWYSVQVKPYAEQIDSSAEPLAIRSKLSSSTGQIEQSGSPTQAHNELNKQSKPTTLNKMAHSTTMSLIKLSRPVSSIANLSWSKTSLRWKLCQGFGKSLSSFGRFLHA